MRRIGLALVLGVMGCEIEGGSGGGATSIAGAVRGIAVQADADGPLGVGASRLFHATSAATWSVVEPDGGSIAGDGTYTAPTHPGHFTVRAARIDAPDVAATATIDVLDVPAVPVIAAPTFATIGARFDLGAGTGDADMIVWQLAGAKALGTDEDGGRVTAEASGESIDVECWARNAAGLESAHARAHVSGVAAPTIAGFSVSTIAPAPGESVTITPTFAGGNGVIDPGAHPVTSGTPITMPAPTSGVVTLTVTNAAGATAKAKAPLAARPTGSIAIALSGGATPPSPGLHLVAPGEAPIDVTPGTTSLPAGAYTLVADPVVAGGVSYSPSPASQPVVITADQTTALSIAYAAVANPPVIGTIPDQFVRADDPALWVRIAATSAPDVAPVSLSFLSSDPDVVDPAAMQVVTSTMAQQSILVPRGAKLGETTITVRATDAVGHLAQTSFRVVQGNLRVSSLADSGPETLRDLLASATAGSVVIFDASLDGGTIALESPLSPGVPVSLFGRGRDTTAISGGDRSEIFLGGAIALHDLTLRGARHAVAGALALTASNATLERVGIENNGLVGNPAGGSLIDVSGQLAIRDCEFRNNRTTNGGIFAHIAGAQVAIQRSTFAGNTCTATNCGVAVRLLPGTSAVIDDSTFTGNALANQSGVIAASGTSSLSLRHSTLAGNHSSYAGGGAAALISVLTAGASPTVSLLDTIVTGNVYDAVPPVPANVANAGAPFTLLGTNLIDVGDPQLGALKLQGGYTPTMCPLAGSPAYGVVDPAVLPPELALDQRGLPRPGNGKNKADVGACEVQP